MVPARAAPVIVSPDLRVKRARCQAETPLIVLCRFPGPPLNLAQWFGINSRVAYKFALDYNDFAIFVVDDYRVDLFIVRAIRNILSRFLR